MTSVLLEILNFFRRHWIHCLIALPMLIGWTVLHELAHCVAAWLQGGTVTEFVWLPSGSHWGHMQYVGPDFTPLMHQLVSLAPYIAWSSFTLLACLLTLRTKPYSFAIASSIYVWLFIFPTADSANAAIPYIIWNAQNDFSNAFGERSILISMPIILCGIVITWTGYYLNRRLYATDSLNGYSYLILSLFALFFIGFVT